MNSDKDIVLILGGCGRRGQQAAKRCIDQGCIVIVVDNTTDHDKQPENWPPETNVNESRNFGFYSDNILNFLCTENFLSGTKYTHVFHYARVKDADTVTEVTSNCILDAVFFKWVNLLPRPLPNIVYSTDTLLGNYMLRSNLIL